MYPAEHLVPAQVAAQVLGEQGDDPLVSCTDRAAVCGLISTFGSRHSGLRAGIRAASGLAGHDAERDRLPFDAGESAPTRTGAAPGEAARRRGTIGQRRRRAGRPGHESLPAPEPTDDNLSGAVGHPNSGTRERSGHRDGRGPHPRVGCPGGLRHQAPGTTTVRASPLLSFPPGRPSERSPRRWRRRGLKQRPDRGTPRVPAAFLVVPRPIVSPAARHRKRRGAR